MSKTPYLILSVIVIFSLAACESFMTASPNNSASDNTTTVEQSNTGNEGKLSNTISWVDYPDKYITLMGIKYPHGFIMHNEGPMTGERYKGLYFPMEIYSTTVPLYQEDYCHFRPPCAAAGLQINISKSVIPAKSELKDTNFPNIKSKVLLEKRGGSAAEVAEVQKYYVDKEIKEYLYSEYYFISSAENTKTAKSYLIQVYERNFNGDAVAVVDGILSSLHE
jgi:hypothetical protein